MARLQILELPEGSGDDRPPFILVVDQYQPQRYILGPDQPEPVSEFDGIAEQIGARAVLTFAESVDIPANNLPSGTEEIEASGPDFVEMASTVRRTLGIDMTQVGVEPDVAGWLLKACRELEKSEAARAQLREDHAEARQWARHGYECGIRAAKSAARPRDEKASGS